MKFVIIQECKLEEGKEGKRDARRRMGYAYVAESEGKMKAYEGVNMKRQLLPEREVYIICSHKGVRANDFFL